MSITRHKDSHLDHNLTSEQIKFVLGLDAPEGGTQTVTLPEHLGTVQCGLYGPLMGDAPIEESEVSYHVRGERKGKSRLIIGRAPRTTRLLTVISGPHDGLDCVLFTAFGGPLAEREPFEDDSEKSREFWKQHALSG